MITFKSNEFEIAVVTYKRPEFIRQWLDLCFEQSFLRNIKISVYDSSPDNETEKVVKDFNLNRNDSKVFYQRVDNVIIGYKPMIPILNSNSEYLWISGDSRYHDFEELDQKLFPLIKNRTVDYAVINFANKSYLPNIIFDDNNQMIKNCFVSSTCIGTSIYRTAIFNPIKKDSILLSKYNGLFKNNYAFGWLGYFYSLYALDKYSAALVNVHINNILPKKKVQSWAVRFYGCWVDDLCDLADNLPDSYSSKRLIPRDTWNIMKLNSISYGYKARKFGDLTKDKFNELVSNGLLERITNNTFKIKFFATSPIFLIDCIFQMNRGFSFIKKIIKHLTITKGNR